MNPTNTTLLQSITDVLNAAEASADQVISLQNQCSALQSQLDSANVQITSLSGSNFQAERDALTSQIADLQIQLAAQSEPLREQVASLTAQNSELSAKLSAALADLS